LSPSSFNALLKSIEEPPPHVVFMMATTELQRIPETILSRSQVYEFRTIGTSVIADQLAAIARAEGIDAADEALFLIARDADGSMRDAQSKLDQVIAFTGNRITTEDVGGVLGLVGREMILATLQAVADEDAAAAFALAGRAVDLGYDLRLVCRELSRGVRDLLVLAVDPSRISDPEVAADGEREQLLALTRRFSREDLLRSFDLLTQAETDIRAAAQPRYHLEMALLRWIHLRKLVPLEDLLQSLGSGNAGPRPAAAATSRAAGTSSSGNAGRSAPAAPESPVLAVRAVPGAASAPRPSGAAARPDPLKAAASDVAPGSSVLSGSALRDAILSEARRSSPVLYNTVIAQARQLELIGDRLVLTFPPSFKSPAFEKYRGAIESIATKLAHRRIAVEADASGSDASPAEKSGSGVPGSPEDPRKKSALKEQALTDPGVQALLEVFPADIRDVEEM
jgi:DNA polymerase-3 subunit gamma/tau